MFAPTTKILVVDDMKTMRKVLMRALTEIGFSNFVEAEDGQAAWTAIEGAMSANAPIQLIISDWNMPKMKGLELLRKVRGNAKTAATPFVMVTAEVEADSQKEVLEGANRVDGFLSKPFKADQLRQVLETAQKTAKAA